VEEEETSSTGGLRTEIIISQEKVWVCDKAIACSPNHVNAICFKYHERDQTFNPWGFSLISGCNCA